MFAQYHKLLGNMSRDPFNNIFILIIEQYIVTAPNKSNGVYKTVCLCANGAMTVYHF